MTMHFYNVRYEGCNHDSILSERQLHADVKGQQLNPEKGVKEDLYFCPDCLEGIKPGCNMIDGRDDRSVLRTVAAMRQLSPLDLFKIGAIGKAGS
jgi:hypothetical protein